MVENYDELQDLSDDQVQARYNAEARRATSSLNFWRDELWRRESQRTNRRMLVLTAVVTVLTLVNVAVVIVD